MPYGATMIDPSIKENIVQQKSYSFALSILKLARALRVEQKEWVLSKQLVRSGTSIGANIEEAVAAQSKRDFLSKMSIALKEARETHYWLRILKDSGITDEPQAEPLVTACQELVRLLNSITLTTRRNLESRQTMNRKASSFQIPHSTLEP